MVSRPRTKAPRAQQLKGELKGDLAVYEQVGLFQRSVNRNTAYRYRGALLRYQEFLGDNPPSLNATLEYLSSLRKNEFDPATLHVYRAALAGYHQFRGEELKFAVKVQTKTPILVPDEIVNKMLELAAASPRDHLILRLMTDAGMRRDEVVNLTAGSAESGWLRFTGKGNKERRVPMTDELKTLVTEFSAGKARDEKIVGLGEKGIYGTVKRYAERAGMPELTPHGLRHYFGTRMMEKIGDIRIVQELLGHANVNTTQIYTSVRPERLEQAIAHLNTPSPAAPNPRGKEIESHQECAQSFPQPPDTLEAQKASKAVSPKDLVTFNNSDRILSERQLVNFLLGMENHSSYRMSEYVRLLKYWDYFSTEGNRYSNRAANEAVKTLWDRLDKLVLFLKLEFEANGKDAKAKDPHMNLKPAGLRNLRDDKAKTEIIARKETELQGIIKDVRDSYQSYRATVRDTLQV